MLQMEKDDSETVAGKSVVRHAPAILALLLASVVFYTAFQNARNVLWWDETEYALLAKNVVDKGRYSYWDDFYFFWYNGDSSFRAPLLPALIATSYLLFGQSELSMRLVVPFLSALGVLATFLVARKLFGDLAGVISASLLSFTTLYWFYAGRVLTETPLVFFSAMMFYAFYGVFEEKKWHWLPLLAAFTALGFLMKYTILAIAPPLAFILLLYYRKPVLEALGSQSGRKSLACNAAIAIALAVLLAAPMLWFSTRTMGGPLKTMEVYLASAVGSEPLLYYFTILSHIFSNIFVVLLVIAGTIYAFYASEKRGVQLAVLFLSILAVMSIVIEHKEDRYAMLIYPFAFALAGLVASKALVAVAKIRSASESSIFKIGFALVFVVPALYYGTVGNVSNAKALLEPKLDSYLEVARAGNFIMQNSAPGTRVISDSFYQTGYYSDRPVDLLPSTSKEFAELLQKSNAQFIEFSFYQHGGMQLAEASRALSQNLTPPDTPGAYVLSNPETFQLVDVEKFPDGNSSTFVFKRVA